MNVHHLELFHHVARHGGIMEAVRNMPYGIQQPAVSSQILRLEEDLGVKLFRRRPFELTAAGRDLYAFVKPFFGELDRVGERIRAGGARTLRLAAPVAALREHLPEELSALARRFPGLRFTLRSGLHPEVEAWLERREIDYAISLLPERHAPEITTVPLLSLPLEFVVPARSRWRAASEILASLASETPPAALIALPEREPAMRALRDHLAAAGLEWPTAIEVTELDLVAVYVRGGFGIGLGVGVPGERPARGVRRVAIPEIPPLRLGAMWHGEATDIMLALTDALRRRALTSSVWVLSNTEATP